MVVFSNTDCAKIEKKINHQQEMNVNVNVVLVLVVLVVVVAAVGSDLS